MITAGNTGDSRESKNVVKKQPKLIGYMSALYERMSSEAEEVSIGDNQSVQVWRGRLIATCLDVGIPEGYYKKVVDTLRKLGCIEQANQGRRGANATMVILRYPPTEQMYDEVLGRAGWEGLTSRPSFDTMAGELRDIQRRLGGIDIVDALKNHEDRIAELETAIKALTTTQHKTNKGE